MKLVILLLLLPALLCTSCKKEPVRFRVHANTPYIDVIKEKYPDEFKPSCWKRDIRIDFVYCTKPLYDRVT